MRSAALEAAAKADEEAARHHVERWCTAVRQARAEYRKIVGEPAPHPSMWVPDEHGAPTVVVEGITLVFKTDYQSTFTDRRLHAADVPIRSLAQLGRLIQRTDREVSP